VAWSFKLHGTMFASGHTMAVLISISMMWMGVLYHHYPVITGRTLNQKLGSWFIKLYMVGAIGAMYAMLAAGAAGMPRRFAAWNQEGWMIYGVFILIFGLILGASLFVFAYDLLKSSDITTTPGEQATAIS
jgi:cytochrome c oxidase subunit 1